MSTYGVRPTISSENYGKEYIMTRYVPSILYKGSCKNLLCTTTNCCLSYTTYVC